MSHFQCFAACPANTEWVVVSNGDNDYAKTFFSRIGAVKDADVIAFDFYSRYHRATGASQPPASCTVHGTHHVQAYDCHDEAAASEVHSVQLAAPGALCSTPNFHTTLQQPVRECAGKQASHSVQPSVLPMLHRRRAVRAVWAAGGGADLQAEQAAVVPHRPGRQRHALATPDGGGPALRLAECPVRFRSVLSCGQQESLDLVLGQTLSRIP